MESDRVEGRKRKLLGQLRSPTFPGHNILFSPRQKEQKPQRINLLSPKSTQDSKEKRASFPQDTKKVNDSKASSPLSPFEKIKIESGRKFSHGHPLILPSAYGEFGPVFDVFALFQNAVKKQILVAYNMLEVLLRSKYEVTHNDTESFFHWFETFEEVVLVLFDVEETHVFPFLLEQGVEIPESLGIDERTTIYTMIETSLNLVSGKRDMVRMLPPGECIPQISNLLTDFLHLIVQYYDTQSKILPRLICTANIDGDAEIMIRSRFISALRAKNNYSTSLPFVAHWLTGQQLRVWKANYLGPVLSARFEQWARKFDATHGAIPLKLVQRFAPGIKGDDSGWSSPSLFGGKRHSSRNQSLRRRSKSMILP